MRRRPRHGRHPPPTGGHECRNDLFGYDCDDCGYEYDEYGTDIQCNDHQLGNDKFSYDTNNCGNDPHGTAVQLKGALLSEVVKVMQARAVQDENITIAMGDDKHELDGAKLAYR